MKPMTPSEATNQGLFNKSVARVLVGNTSLGSGSKFDASGIPTEYIQDNGDGVLIRHTFVANTATVIAHSLNRIPIGYFVTRSNTPCVLSDPMTNAGWTKKELVLLCNASADVTFYVF